ncbi:MAG: hypothetical protein HYU66_04790 [Armatimonadetes bacterium]|nr:hypothetical protein [Armatimonadota bacterium]
MSSSTLLLMLGLATTARGEGGPPESSFLEVDHRALVSLSDLVYLSPAAQPAEGLPVGNGRMGTLVWTTPSAVHMQINRSDVFAANKHHAGSFTGPVDQCWGACAQIAVDIGGQPFAAGKAFTQRLSLYQAETTITGARLAVRCFVSAATDVLALEIDDRRDEPQPVRLTVSMWRAPEVVRGEHVARYEFADSPGTALVVQRYQEKDYHCSSAVAAQFAGGPGQPETVAETARTIVSPPKQGKRTILISSAASWAAAADVGKVALGLLNGAAKHGYDDLLRAHSRWWRGFWSRTFVHLSSDDGLAEIMQRVRSLHLYYLASTSRGALPAKWNGSLFSTDGDTHYWGSQLWVWTTEMLYFPLLAADAVDLTDPFFDMYVRQLPDCEQAALQRWSVPGAYFPETTPFDGPVVLPPDAALEYQQVMLGAKKNTELSARARALGLYESHLFVLDHPTTGRYTWISHVASSGSELAVHAWWRYRYTGDKRWLRSHAYPLLRGTVEFYRHLARKGEDGRYHLSGTNVHEDFWGVRDGIMDLAAIRGTAPLAIRAAEILGVDPDLRDRWQELLHGLAPYPMGSDPESRALKDGVLADDVWAAGHLGDVNDGHRNSEDVWLNPVFPFEDWTLETRSAATDALVQKTLELAPRHASVMHGDGLNTAIRTPIAVARAGRGEELPAMLACYYAAFSPLPNGMSLFESAKDASVEHLGLLTTVLQEGLLQSVSPRPGEPEIIGVAPAWPNAWQATFRLLARGGFLVTAAVRGGEVEFVELHSRLGGTCRLRSPWRTPCVVTQSGRAPQELAGDVLSFGTRRGGQYLVLPKGRPAPAPRRVGAAPTAAPAVWQITLPNGKVVGGTLGRP